MVQTQTSISIGNLEPHMLKYQPGTSTIQVTSNPIKYNRKNTQQTTIGQYHLTIHDMAETFKINHIIIIAAALS